jgi:hypothetical protein
VLIDQALTANWPSGASFSAAKPEVDWGGLLADLPVILSTAQQVLPVVLQIVQTLKGPTAG